MGGAEFNGRGSNQTTPSTRGESGKTEGKTNGFSLFSGSVILIIFSSVTLNFSLQSLLDSLFSLYVIL